jgi:hypothetical protein
MPIYINVNLTGTDAGQVLTGNADSDTLTPGVGNNFLFGDGNTTADYVNAPNGVSVNVANATVANGYGGTDTLSDIHSLVGSSAGTNTVIYDGTHTDYRYQQLSGGWFEVTDRRAGSPDGVDQYQNVQEFDFSDGTYTPGQLLEGQTPPAVTTGNPAVTFTAGGSAVTLDNVLSITDGESTTLTGATVSITAGTFSGDGDVLNTNISGTAITASYNNATETLTLSGTDTLADYQAVLRLVTFTSTSQNPTDSDADPSRTVSWAVNDGISPSTAVTTTLNVTGTVSPPSPHVAPTVSGVSTVSVAENQSIAASSLIASISNPSGDNITLYIFEDAGGGSGYFTVNGVRQPDGQWIIPASSSDNVQYVGGSSPGTDTLDVGIYDYSTNQYYTSSTTTSATTMGNSAPVATVNNQTVKYGQQVPLTDLFSVSGGGITEYQVWFGDPEDGSPALGALTNNGKAIAKNQWVTLSSLSGLEYTGSATAGTDKIWVRAYNGSWSDTSEADITDPGLSAPVVRGHKRTVTDGEQIALTRLFSVTGHRITQYQLWFGDREDGSPALGAVTRRNGNPIAHERWVTVNSLRSLEYSGSAKAGTDKIWVTAYNGVWSSMGESDITDRRANRNASAQISTTTPATENIAPGTTIEIDSVYSGMVTFAGNTGTLQIDQSSTFSGTVAGMSGQDTLDLRDINPAKVHTPTFSGTSSSGTLTVTDGTHTANIALLGNYLASTFVASSDGHGGTSIVDPALASSGQLASLAQPHHS